MYCKEAANIKSFALDSNGDLLISNGEIQMVHGEELTRQCVEKVLGTNKGEWSLNIDEGITFSNMLGKGVNEELVQNEILQGLLQVDSSFSFENFTCDIDQHARKVTVKFTAKTETGESVAVNAEY